MIHVMVIAIIGSWAGVSVAHGDPWYIPVLLFMIANIVGLFLIKSK